MHQDPGSGTETYVQYTYNGRRIIFENQMIDLLEGSFNNPFPRQGKFYPGTYVPRIPQKLIHYVL